MWLTAFTAAGAAAYAASTLLPVRGLHDWIVRGTRFRTDAGAIALTFDDGPHPERTPAILDLLAGADAKATFFLVGERAAEHPEIVRRIAREGHEIGNHSWSHPWMPKLSAGRIETELLRCQEVIAGITQQAPRIVRPPYGSRDFRFYRIASRLGLTPALWSLDSLDWTGASAARVLKRSRRAKGGDIVLLHDGNPRAESTIPALRHWLAELPRDACLAPLRPRTAACNNGLG
ncbi:MAG: polysaccharide deacetylase family protein [Alphaproteobacteria bacterium]|nr:polysaccharide deacetylase family protein [Alphaproteobacteria bacterium]